MPSVVVLLSGGLDSMVAAFWARSYGYRTHALTLQYGQRHAREIASAVAIGARLEVASHDVVAVDLGVWGGSALLRGTSPRRLHGPRGEGISPAYVPARNLVFLSVAASLAESKGAEKILLGVHRQDGGGFPDCRPEFLRAFQEVIRLGTGECNAPAEGIVIVAPFLSWSKAQILREGASLGADFSETWSCYVGGAEPCQQCEACETRRDAFAEAGLADPLLPCRC